LWLLIVIEDDKMHKAVEVNLQKINAITDDQTFYNAQFAKAITEVSPVTDKAEDGNKLISTTK
jgi:hypothetical protein